MSKKQFKDIMSTMVDDLYSKGYKDGVKSCKRIELVKVEVADGSFIYNIRLGTDPQHYTYIEIPKALIERVK